MMMSDEEKRWLVVGIAMNKVTAPVLRDFIKQGMDTHYANNTCCHGLAPPCMLNTLTYHHVSADPTLRRLKFQNINNNINNHGNHKTLYNYNINSSVDLAKLFLPDYLAEFSGFNESLDMSAILRLLGCNNPAPIFHSSNPLISVQLSADDVRENVRKKWGHCNLTDWTKDFFNDCFSKLETLVRSLGLTGAMEKTTLDQLSNWQTKGCQLSIGHAVDQNLLSPVQQDVKEPIKKYKESEGEQPAIQESLAQQKTEQTEMENIVTSMMKENDKIVETLVSVEKTLNEELLLLTERVEKGLAETDDKVEQLERGFAKTDGKVEQLEGGFAKTDDKVDQLERGFAKTDGKVEQLERGFAKADDKVEQLERGFAKADDKVQQLEQGFAKTDDKLEQPKRGFAETDGKVEQLEQKVRSQKMKENQPVPQEIEAQGHRAEAAFREAMEKGSVEVYRGRIMLIGQDRAGKTSLKKFLLGIPFDPEEESTVGIKVDPTKFEVEIDQVKNWQFTDHKKLDLSEYREDIAKITAEHIKALEGENQETTDSMDLQQELNDPFRLQCRSKEDAEGFEQSDSNQGSKAETDPSTSNVQQNDMLADQDVQLIDTTGGLTLGDVTEKVEQCLQGLELNDDVKAKEVILSVWDFAGQNLYYASHSVFLSHRAIYVLVHNLSKDLSAQAKPYAQHETRKIELENPTNQTNLDNLLSWLVSVHCIRPTRDEVSEVWKEKEEKCPPYLRPPVFVVGTHADEPFKDIRDMLQYIQDSISGKRYDEHIIRPLYAVDNTRSASDYGVQALQNRILEVLKQEPYMGEKVPIRWFHFEKVVEALVANKIYHMELNKLLKYTKRYCHIDKEDELITMLKFYHDLGVIVKHGRTVVLRALWLIDLFKQLINVRPYDERDPRYSGCWQELKENGILRMDLVDHVFTDFIQKDFSRQDVLKMMEDHGLIAKISFFPADGDHQQEYFVPSLLKSLPSGLYEIKPANCDPCPLYLHFLDGFVPHGLFAQLVSRCIVWCSGRSPEIPELYQNGVVFFFIGKERIFDLVLICRKRFIKIILTRNPQARRVPSTTYSATKAREVRVFLESTLKDMREELSWLRNMRYELCVACTHCLKSPDRCSRHSSVRCADDDCMYLLPLRPEEQLICRKNYDREPIKIYGLEKWLLVHEKESEEREMVSGNPKGAVKEGSPENVDLERLANKIINEWRELGRRLLESDEALLDAIDKDNDKCSEKAYKMLLKWKAAKGSDATFRVLHDALCDDLVNRRDLAEKFCLETDD